MVVLVFVRVRSGASAQLSGAYLLTSETTPVLLSYNDILAQQHVNAILALQTCVSNA